MRKEDLEKAFDAFRDGLKSDLVELGERTKREIREEVVRRFLVPAGACCKCCSHFNNANGSVGYCHRNAPKLESGRSQWPMVLASENCGDFAPNIWTEHDLKEGRRYRPIEGFGLLTYEGVKNYLGEPCHSFKGNDKGFYTHVRVRDGARALNEILEPKWGPK